MKRNLMLLLALLLLFSAFSGCGGSSASSDESAPASSGDLPQVTLFVDVPFIEPRYTDSFLTRVPNRDIQFTVVSETVTGATDNRDTALTRIRTELMAGKGPDVFICSVPQTSAAGESLVNYPEKMMRRNFFLPLDDYIAKARYIKMDEMIPVIMEAGRTEEGQMLLPLAFSLNTELVDTSRYPLPESIPNSLEELAASDDPTLQFIAYTKSLPDYFGQIADYENETLKYTEEELQELARKLAPVYQKGVNAELVDREYFDAFGQGYGRPPFYSDLGENDPVYTPVPVYNSTGEGMTASITCFGAVNRNTEVPEEAFLILDVLMNKQTQQNTGLCYYMEGMIPRKGLGQKSDPIMYNGLWYMSDENYAGYQDLLDKVNVVKFCTPLDGCLDAMGYSIAHQKGDALEKTVHAQYMKMQMMLEES